MRKYKWCMIICAIIVISFALVYFISVEKWQSFIIYLGGIIVSVIFSIVLTTKYQGLKTNTRYFVDPKSRKWFASSLPAAIVSYMKDKYLFEVGSIEEAETFINYYEWSKNQDSKFQVMPPLELKKDRTILPMEISVRGVCGFIVELKSSYSEYTNCVGDKKFDTESIEYEIRLLQENTAEHILKHVKPREIEYLGV